MKKTPQRYKKYGFNIIEGMKNLFMILLATVPITTIAQERLHDSFLEEEKIWTIKTVGSNLERTVSYTEYKLISDTIIDDVSYKQLFSRCRREGEDDWSEWKYDESYIGQDNQGRVLFYHDRGYSIENVVTIDFSLQIDDVYYPDNGNSLPYVVTAVLDTILENSSDRKPRKCIRLSHYLNGEILSGEYNRDIWIEGIGSVKNGLMGTRDLDGGFNLLMKCTKQEEVIYQYGDATSVQEIKQQPSDDKKIYNLEGHRLEAVPSKGIFIQNRRKRVAKVDSESWGL